MPSKQLVADDVINVDGLILVRRRSDGKIHVEDDFHTHAMVCLGRGRRRGHRPDLPPTLLAGALVGAGVGGGVGAHITHGDKNAIKAEVQDTLRSTAPASWRCSKNNGLARSTRPCPKPAKVTKEQVDAASAAEVKTAAAKNP
jgi:hypothetical protein